MSVHWFFLGPPLGWEGHGHVPINGAEAGDEWIGEDLAQYRRGRVTLDVGWSGTDFVCRTVFGDNWEGSELVRFAAHDYPSVLRWLGDEVMRLHDRAFE